MQPTTKPPDDRPILGYCSQHPRETATVAYRGPETNGETRWFCRECWRAFRKRTKNP